MSIFFLVTLYQNIYTRAAHILIDVLQYMSIALPQTHRRDGHL